MAVRELSSWSTEAEHCREGNTKYCLYACQPNILSYTGLSIIKELPATTALDPIIAAAVHVGIYIVFNVDHKPLTSGEIFQLVYKYWNITLNWYFYLT
jgi:hypothetical protein